MNDGSNDNSEDVKGFNDSELEDIMNEIESLEKEFDGAEKETSKPVAKDSQKPEAPVPMVSDNVVPLSHSAPQAKPPVTHVSSSQSSLSLNVEGKIGVHMTFQFGPHLVSFKVEEGGLCIEMQNGAKFTIPLEDIKKSA